MRTPPAPRPDATDPAAPDVPGDQAAGNGAVPDPFTPAHAAPGDDRARGGTGPERRAASADPAPDDPATPRHAARDDAARDDAAAAGRFVPGKDLAPGAAALRGFLTLAEREIQRFLKVWAQALGAPVVTTLLFLAIFVLALGNGGGGGPVPAGRAVAGVPFLEFLGAGLAMMALAQNAFANSATSLVISKIQGNIVDLLMAPLPPAALLGGLVAGAVARGLAVAAVVLATMWPIVAFPAPAPLLALAAALLGAALLGLLGVLAGLWAEKFDQMATVTNFIVTPLAFLSGTFYSVERLPEPLRLLAHADPLFWMIDAFRAGLTGHADGNAVLGLIGLAAIDAVLWLLALALVRRGWRLRA